ncbi:MAG: serine/threonine protein kinase, partial [Treponemataceae bacterium]|nr:serine/threonine protein kinase [Treponemataceae bacterium]
MAESVPPFIGKYKVLGIIAKGGMGVVYKAMHPSLKRYVVIKKMTARRNSANVERFKREAQILLDLRSPYIVHLFDYFTEGSYRYMVEELVDGMALDKLLQKQTVVSPQIAMLILQDACFALKYAHSKDIVHRDIKPGNILISKRAEIKLADFGIASDKEQDEESLTQTGTALGTPAYMPPEQFENSANVDQRADIYALGVMLYEMATGTKPYPGTLSVETLNTIRRGKYIPPKKIDKSIPNEVCRLIKKMLRPKPNQRFQSTEPILKAAKRYLKRYDVHAVRVQLAKLVLSDELVKEAEFVPKDLRLRKVRRIVALCALAAAAAAGCWHAGLIQRYLLRRWITPVSIEMYMPATLSADADLPA